MPAHDWAPADRPPGKDSSVRANPRLCDISMPNRKSRSSVATGKTVGYAGGEVRRCGCEGSRLPPRGGEFGCRRLRRNRATSSGTAGSPVPSNTARAPCRRTPAAAAGRGEASRARVVRPACARRPPPVLAPDRREVRTPCQPFRAARRSRHDTPDRLTGRRSPPPPAPASRRRNRTAIAAPGRRPTGISGPRADPMRSAESR